MGVEDNPQYRKQGEPNQSPREGGRDYAAMFSYIRADKDTQSFIADLRDNKQQLPDFSVVPFRLNFMLFSE
jgi:hypothetical protein